MAPSHTGLYIPRDYAKSYRGPVTVRQALGGSLNVPAVRTLVMLGGEDRERGEQELAALGAAAMPWPR